MEITNILWTKYLGQEGIEMRVLAANNYQTQNLQKQNINFEGMNHITQESYEFDFPKVEPRICEWRSLDALLGKKHVNELKKLKLKLLKKSQWVKARELTHNSKISTCEKRQILFDFLKDIAEDNNIIAKKTVRERWKDLKKEFTLEVFRKRLNDFKNKCASVVEKSRRSLEESKWKRILVSARAKKIRKNRRALAAEESRKRWSDFKNKCTWKNLKQRYKNFKKGFSWENLTKKCKDFKKECAWKNLTKRCKDFKKECTWKNAKNVAKAFWGRVETPVLIIAMAFGGILISPLGSKEDINKASVALREQIGDEQFNKVYSRIKTKENRMPDFIKNKCIEDDLKKELELELEREKALFDEINKMSAGRKSAYELLHDMKFISNDQRIVSQLVSFEEFKKLCAKVDKDSATDIAFKYIKFLGDFNRRAGWKHALEEIIAQRLKNGIRI